MREIKFRAWDKKHLVMIGQKGMLSLDAVFEDPGHFVPMQFTGIKDKKGKEIYEGDVVSVPDMDYDPAEGGVPDLVSEVVFSQGLFGTLCNTGITALSEDDIENMQVIGNIYENPELMEK